FQGTIDFGGGPMTSDGGSDAYVAVFSTSMFSVYHSWSAQLSGAEDQQGTDVAFDYSGNIVTVGWFRGALAAGAQQRTSAGAKDLFVVKHTAGGALIWLETVGDAS